MDSRGIFKDTTLRKNVAIIELALRELTSIHRNVQRIWDEHDGSEESEFEAKVLEAIAQDDEIVRAAAEVIRVYRRELEG